LENSAPTPRGTYSVAELSFKAACHGAGIFPALTPPARPPHHRPGGGFRNPWVDHAVPGFGSLLKWMLVHRTTRPRPKDPDPSVFARVPPDFVPPRAPPSQLSVAG